MLECIVGGLDSYDVVRHEYSLLAASYASDQYNKLGV